MPKKLLSVTVKGTENTYSFNFVGDTKYLQEWRDDGLIIDEVLNVIPVEVVNAGWLKPWIFLQDVFNFKNPFSRG